MKAKNIELRAMADGKHRVVGATVIQDDGTERRATLGDIQSIEGYRMALAHFLRAKQINLTELLSNPALRAKFEQDWVVILYRARGHRILAGCTYAH